MINLKYIILILIFSFVSSSILSENTDEKRIFAKKINEEIVLDGEMNEDFWKEAEAKSNFFQVSPRDSISAELDSEFRIAYDDKYLYILAKLEDIPGKKFMVGDLKRDFFGGSIDYIAFMFDTFLDESNAFNFALSPFGIQREALVSDGGEGSYSPGRGVSWFNVNWNTKWYSGVKIHDGYWLCEFKIPFNSIRYQTGSKTWNLQVYRGNSKINERSAWTAVPLGKSQGNLSLTGTLEFEYPLGKSSKNFVVVPYVSGSGLQNKTTSPVSKDFDMDAGLDVKLSLSSSLNLDLTFNPDFSQVEVDEQRTNLTRFELFYPEKREFFIDNADLFTDLGSRSTKPMFTRRIGIAKDTTTNQYVQNPIIYGAKLAGKLNEGLRIGILNMQTARLKSSGIPSFNYGMAVLEKKILTNSKILAFLVNKEAMFNPTEDSYSINLNHFNRVFGFESKIKSKDTRWNSELYYHQSLENQKHKDRSSYGANFTYKSPKFQATTYFWAVGENYNPEVGFVPRKDFMFLSPSAKYIFYPNKSSVNSHGPEIDYEMYFDPVNGTTDYDIDIDYNVRFRSDANITIKNNRIYTKLLYDFDPSRSDGEPLPALSDYNYSNYTFYFRSNGRKKTSLSLNGKLGGFFNGKIRTLGGTVTYKLPPNFNVSLSSQFNDLEFPSPYSDAQFLTLSSKINVSFTKDLFLSTYLQYNNQIDNININARFQWRFQPLSDIYLVYTDNYYAENPLFMNLKNRSFAFKINYWLNI